MTTLDSFSPAAGPVRKVIGFDSWTGGARNFERVALVLQCSGIEFHVIHIGSWGVDAGRADDEMVGAVRYRDIRMYANKLDRALEVEQPDAVLFLSTDTFAHRAFNRYCRKRRIPTLHLYHGLVTVQDVGRSRQYRLNLWAQLRFVLERIPKALRLTWPAYWASMLATNAPLSDWVRFVQDNFRGAAGRYTSRSAPDALTDGCCVYTDADRGHAMNKYGFRDEQVVAVGNPDLAHFGLQEESLGSQLVMPSGGNEVMYIDTGLVYTGFVFDSPAHFLQHLVDTRDSLARQGKHLVFKPHPDHARTTMLGDLKASGIDICAREDFMPRLQRCIASIVEPSSLSIVPALLGMPVFLAQYGALSGQNYGAVLTSYPRHHLLKDVDDFTAQMASDVQSLDTAAVQAWVDRNAGPLPAAAMPDRVVATIKNLVRAGLAGGPAPSSIAKPC